MVQPSRQCTECPNLVPSNARATRLVCSRLCKSRRDQRLRRVVWKRCARTACGKEFRTRKPTQAHCSRSCAKRKDNKAQHPCATCENPTSNAKYCTRLCAARGRTLDAVRRWLEAQQQGTKRALTPAVMRYLAGQHGNACQECQWRGVSPTTGHPVLHIVRRDGNLDNTSKDNLLVACPNDAAVRGQANTRTLVPF